MKRFAIVLFGIMLAGMLWYAYAELYAGRHSAPTVPPVPTSTTSEAVAYFSGGCFWCTEADFEKLPGVSAAVSGYAGGHLPDPSYSDVTSETSGHRETVRVHYDPRIVSYRELVEYHFAHIDPLDAGGQFVDRGESYTSAIFFEREEERAAILAEIERLTNSAAFDRPIVTAVLPFTNFYPAEEYHQDYHTKNPLRYGYYRGGSGRDARLTELCTLRAKAGVPCPGAVK